MTGEPRSGPRFVHLRYVLRRLAIYEAIILLAAALICVIAGWSAPDEIAVALMVVGVLVFAAGPISLMGGWGNLRNWQYQYVQTMTGERAHERAQRQQDELRQSMGLVFPSIVLGSLTIGLSLLVQMLFS